MNRRVCREVSESELQHEPSTTIPPTDYQEAYPTPDGQPGTSSPTEESSRRGPEWVRMDSVGVTVVWRKTKIRSVNSTTHASSEQHRLGPQPQGTGRQHELQGNALARHALNEATETLRDSSNINVESIMELIGHAHKLGRIDNTARSQGSHLSYWAAYLSIRIPQM